MQPIVIFHLGTYKTGSSAVQNFLWENRQELLKNGYLYPETGVRVSEEVGTRHLNLIRSFTEGPHSPILGNLIDEINRFEPKNVIISSEAFLTPNRLSTVKNMIDGLREHGFRVFSGVLFLRNLGDFKISLYREFTIRHKNGKTFETFIRARSDWFLYEEIVESLQSIFGGNFAVVRYHKEMSVISEFAGAIGLRLDESYSRADRRENVRSVDALEVEAFRIMNQLSIPKCDQRVLVERIPLQSRSSSLWIDGAIPVNSGDNTRRALQLEQVLVKSDVEELFRVRDGGKLYVARVRKALRRCIESEFDGETFVQKRLLRWGLCMNLRLRVKFWEMRARVKVGKM